MDLNKDISMFEKKLDTLEANGIVFNREEILKAKRVEAINHTSFAIKFVALLGGILGSFTLLGAIYAIDLRLNYIFDLVCAVLFWTLAFWIHTRKKQFVFDTILICLVLMASYFSYMVLDGFEFDSTLNNSLLVISIGIVCLCFFKNELLAFLGAMGVLIGLFVLSLELDLIWGSSFYLILLIISVTLLFLKEPMFLVWSSKIRDVYKPIRLAHILVILGVLNYSSSLSYLGISYNLKSFVFAGVCCCLIWVSVMIIKEQQFIKKQDLVIIVGVGLLLVLPTYMSLGFGLSVLLLLLCFRAQYITGLVLAILSFCYFLFRFYYDLNYSLMIKSLLLMGTGLVLWSLYALVTKKIFKNEH